MIPAFPRGHQTVGRGSVKLGPRSLHFRSASALLFRRVGSIPRRLQGGCSGLSCLFWLLRCFKTTSLVLKTQHFKAERLQNNCRFMSCFCVCVCVVDAFNRLCAMVFHDEVFLAKQNARVSRLQKGVSRRCFNICKRKIAAYFLLRCRDNFQPCLWWENQVF